MSENATKALDATLGKLAGETLTHAQLDAACIVSTGLANLEGATLPLSLLNGWQEQIDAIRTGRSLGDGGEFKRMVAVGRGAPRR